MTWHIEGVGHASLTPTGRSLQLLVILLYHQLLVLGHREEDGRDCEDEGLESHVQLTSVPVVEEEQNLKVRIGLVVD